MKNSDYFDSLKPVLINSIMDDTFIRAETNDFDSFYKNVLTLGYGFVIEKSVK